MAIVRTAEETIPLETNSGWTTVAILLGAAVGAGLALIFATRAGDALRHHTGVMARRFRNRAWGSLDIATRTGAAGDEAAGASPDGDVSSS